MAALGWQRPGATPGSGSAERARSQSDRLDSRRLTVDAAILDSSTSRATCLPRLPLRLDEDRGQGHPSLL